MDSIGHTKANGEDSIFSATNQRKCAIGVSRFRARMRNKGRRHDIFTCVIQGALSVRKRGQSDHKLSHPYICIHGRSIIASWSSQFYAVDLIAIYISVNTTCGEGDIPESSTEPHTVLCTPSGSSDSPRQYHRPASQ